MNDRDLGWLEGLIDGEGSLCLGKHKNSECTKGFTLAPTLSVASTDIRILNRAKEMTGLGSISKLHSGNEKWSPAFQWRVTSNGLRRLLPTVRLTSKERQRTLLIEFLALVRVGGLPKDNKGRYIFNSNWDRMLKIWREMKSLNRRGPKRKF